jgi:transposase
VEPPKKQAKRYQALSDYDRGRIIAYHEAGRSERWIAKQLDRSPSSISRHLNKFKSTGIWQRKIGSGRKPVTTDIVDKRLKNRMVLETSRSEEITIREIQQLSGLNNISYSTIRRRIQ